LPNTFWVTIVTMTTVGYGDYYPKSSMGRFVGIIIALWGVFIVSLFVVSLTNLLEFTKSEIKSYDILMKLVAKDELRIDSVNLLSAAYIQKKVVQNFSNDKMKVLDSMRYFRKYLLKF
jgi:succinate-acetate transporter protein